MMQKEITKARLQAHCAAYPKAQIEDVFKYLFQSAFGCEHAVSSEEKAVLYIREEYARIEQTDAPVTEPLDGAYSRVNLSCLKNGLSPETLGRLFFLSAKKEPNGMASLKEKLHAAREMIEGGTLPFALDDFERCECAWREAGYPAIHHSETFRAAYHPAYRVIANAYVPYLPLLAKIDGAKKKGRVLVAVDGGSGSGKSTLAKFLAELYDCTVFHMDDFFLRPEQRTEARRSEIGGNVDRERFYDEVLCPLTENKTVTYRRFDCFTQTLQPPLIVSPKPLTVIEGVYAMHPTLAPYYTLSVFLEVDAQTQRARIEKREPPFLAKRFFEEWIPLENVYFEQMHIKEHCDLTFAVRDDESE